MTLNEKYAYINTTTLTEDEKYKFSEDESVDVRVAIANYSGNLPLDIIEKLSKDKHELVRGAIAFRDDISFELRETFMTDKSTRVKEFLAANDSLTEEEIIRIWNKSRNLRIKDTIIRRRQDMTQELWDKLKK